MSDLNHTKSLIPYKAILESHEDTYRETSSEERSDFIDKISNDIKEAATKKGAKIASGEALHKVHHVLAL